MSQPILADNNNNSFSILAGFGDLLDKSKKSHGDELIEIVQSLTPDSEEREIGRAHV